MRRGGKDKLGRTGNHTKKKKRKRRIVWFNPPYNTSLKSNIAREFFTLLETSFPKKHRFSSIINRHTIKLSYSTTPNMEKIIAGINGSKLKKAGSPTRGGTMNNNNTIVEDEGSTNLDQQNNLEIDADKEPRIEQNNVLNIVNEGGVNSNDRINDEETYLKEPLGDSNVIKDINGTNNDKIMVNVNISMGNASKNAEANVPELNRLMGKEITKNRCDMGRGKRTTKYNHGRVDLISNKASTHDKGPGRDYVKCNCRIKDNCPLQNKCLTENSV